MLSPPFFIVTHEQKTYQLPAWLTTGKTFGVKTKKNITDSARKGLKGARDIILIHKTVYLGDQYMTDGQKATLFPTFPTYCHSKPRGAVKSRTRYD